MKRYGRAVLVLLFLILLVAAYGVYGILETGRPRSIYSFSVIVRNSSDERWEAFREGLEQGAEDFGVYVSVISTGRVNSPEEEAAIIRREMENGADGIIVEPCARDEDRAMQSALSSVKALQVCSDDIQGGEFMIDAVMPDSLGIGEAVASALLRGEGAGRGLRVGVLSGNQRQSAMQDVLESFGASLAESGITPAWILSEEEIENGAELAEQMSSQPVQVIAALDDAATEQAAQLAAAWKGPSFRIYGEGRSTRNLYDLDYGVISALVVPDEYYMGYRCVETMAGYFGIFRPDVKRQEIAYLTVTPETLHEEEKVGILFPTVR